MKNISVFVFIISCLILFSCRKKTDDGDEEGSSLLVKTVQIYNSGPLSTLVTNYLYDTSKRLIEKKSDLLYLRIYRNEEGIITHTVHLAADRPHLMGYVYRRYNYSLPENRYTSSICNDTTLGTIYSDSTQYLYDNEGRLSSSRSFGSTLPSPYSLRWQEDYTYSASGNRLLSLRQSIYNPSTGTLNMAWEWNYTYDTQINPLHLYEHYEAILMRLYEFNRSPHGELFSMNNIQQMDFIDINIPSNSLTTTITYTYDPSGRPVSAVVTENPSAVVSNITYYYQ
jgi:hypothetical protein